MRHVPTGIPTKGGGGVADGDLFPHNNDIAPGTAKATLIAGKSYVVSITLVH